MANYQKHFSVKLISGLFIVGVSIVLILMGLIHLSSDEQSSKLEFNSTITKAYLSKNGGTEEEDAQEKKDIPASFSEEELNQIAQFKELTKDIVLTQTFMEESTYIIRWINDQENNVIAAAEKFRKTIEWRIENNIDNILEEDYSDIMEKCPFSIEGHTKTGNPIAIVPFGSWELNKVVLLTTTDRLYRNQYNMLEKYARIVQDLSTKNNRVQKLFAIIDFNGFAYRVHGCYTCVILMKSMFKTFEEHYPEFAQAWFIINVPKSANFLMNIILPFLSTRNHKITKIYGYDKTEWSSELLKEIDADQLPKKYV